MKCETTSSRRCGEAEDTVDKSRWYVAYTYPRHEKAVADQLQMCSVETFLPTYKHVSRWKDRRVCLQVPLFSGYVFTRMAAQDRTKVLSTPSVIRILSFQGKPVPVSDAEIDAIRICVERGAKLEPHPFVVVGDQVRVREGVFEGLTGIVVRHKNSCKLVVSVALIHQSISLEIDPQSLEIMASAKTRSAEHRAKRARVLTPAAS